MRPVDKGKKPDLDYSEYGDVKEELIKRIGAFCSFCELPIRHIPEVEHREAKSRGGSKLAWDNLLLSCKYCNCRKGTKVAAGQKSMYLWPDEDDTFHAYTYQDGMPRLNDKLSENSDYRERAEKMFQLVKLDHVPTSVKDKDRRMRERIETFNVAKDMYESWLKIKSEDFSIVEEYKKMLLQLAVARGFFSVWMEIFKEVPEIRSIFIKGFASTNKKYFSDCT